MTAAGQDTFIAAPARLTASRNAWKRIGMPERLFGIVVPFIAVVVWEVLARAGVLPPNWFPAPSVVARTIYELAITGELWSHLGFTLWRIAAGFTIGASFGTIVGGVTGYIPTARKLLDPMLQSLRNIPSMAWVPLFLLWLGIHETSKIGLIALGAFFPVYLNLTSGIQHVDPKLIEVGHIYRLSGFRMFRRIILPAALPCYFVGLRSGLGLAWMFVVAAEIMGASRGLGFLMIDGQMTGRASVILASVILFACLGKATDLLVERLGDRLLPHKR